MTKLLKREWLRWTRPHIPDFKCFVCSDNAGRWKVKIQDGPAIVNVVCCDRCVEMTADWIMEAMRESGCAVRKEERKGVNLFVIGEEEGELLP